MLSVRNSFIPPLCSLNSSITIIVEIRLMHITNPKIAGGNAIIL